MKFRGLILFLILATTFSLASDETTTAKLDKLLTAYHDAGMLNGAVLVADHGTVIYKKAFGMANFEWQVPNTTDARFRIGSVTKPFTAVLVLQQVQKGRIRLDAPVAEYLPDYRKDTAQKVTVRHLLAHTSGIPTYKGPDILAQKDPRPYADLAKKWCSGDLRWQPGEKWDYNNCGYLLLGMILERTTGKTYAQLLRENITVPAGMTDTGIDTVQAYLDKRAYGYERNLVQGLQPAPYTEISTALGAGDIYSTLDDLYRFDRALEGDQLLSAESRRLMFTPNNERTGLGWFVRKAPPDHPAAGDTLQFHEGHIFGFFTMYTRVPERHALVVTIDNTDDDSFVTIQREIFNVLYKGTYTLPRKPLERELGRVYREKGVEGAISRYKQLRTSDAGFELSEWRSLNRLGYAMLRAGHASDAAAIFALNTEIFPERWEAWDSLAEAYMVDGKRDLAIKNYQKSIDMNPKNEAGIEALKKLKSGA